MTIRIMWAWLLPVMLLLPQVAAAEPPRAWAYTAWWMPESWKSAPIDKLDRLLFFELQVEPSGAVGERHGWPDQWHELRTAARQKNVPLDLALTLFGAPAFESLFSSQTAIDRLLDAATKLAMHPDVHGLQIDFEVYETIRPATLTAYRRFVVALAERLRKLEPRRQLSVFFPMGAATDLYDQQSLAVVDHVIMQGYDSHWKGSAHAGPVAPLKGDEAVTWEKALAKGVTLGVPRERLLMSFPLYGYEWTVDGTGARAKTRGQGITTTYAPVPAAWLPDIRVNIQDRVLQHGARHDPRSGASYYQFRSPEGKFVEGWFEDWWSLKHKTAFLRREQLGGMAFFILGYDNNALLNYYLDGAP